MFLWNNIVISFALALIVIGLILLPLPIPFGLLTFAAGITLLLSRSQRATLILKAWRLRWRRLDRGFRWVEDISPPRLGDIIRRTRP